MKAWVHLWGPAAQVNVAAGDIAQLFKRVSVFEDVELWSRGNGELFAPAGSSRIDVLVTTSRKDPGDLHRLLTQRDRLRAYCITWAMDSATPRTLTEKIIMRVVASVIAYDCALGETVARRIQTETNMGDTTTELLEREIERLRDAVAAAEGRAARIETGWHEHVNLPDDDEVTPRMDMECNQVSDWKRVWTQYFVYRHFLGHAVAVPFNRTEQLGAVRKLGGLEDAWANLPFRDGSHFRHDARALDVPAFIVLISALGVVTRYEVPRERLA